MEDETGAGVLSPGETGLYSTAPTANRAAAYLAEVERSKKVEVKPQNNDIQKLQFAEEVEIDDQAFSYEYDDKNGDTVPGGGGKAVVESAYDGLDIPEPTGPPPLEQEFAVKTPVKPAPRPTKTRFVSKLSNQPNRGAITFTTVEGGERYARSPLAQRGASSTPLPNRRLECGGCDASV